MFCLGIAVVAATASCANKNASDKAVAMVRAYAPPLCYLVAEQMSLDLKVAVAKGTPFKGSLPPECDDGNPLADNAAWAARLSELRSESIAAIEAEGFSTLPSKVEVTATESCGVNRPLNGPGEIQQKGYDLLLASPDAPKGTGIRGAIAGDHVVFLVIGGPEGNDPFYSEPLFGEWKSDAVELLGIKAECVVSVKKSG